MAGIGIDKIILCEDLRYIDPVMAQRFCAIARSQLEILQNFMRFQNLNQGTRRINIGSGIIVTCNISFGHRQAFVDVPSTGEEEAETKTIYLENQYLLIVYGNPEEYIDITYTKESLVFIAESVTCTEGSGTIIAVEGNRLYGSFTMCWTAMVYGDDSNASAGISSAIEQHYLRTYEKQEIISAGLTPFTITEDYSLNNSLEIQPLSDVPAKGDPRIGNEWTKTLGFFNVTAFTYYPPGMYGIGTKKWSVSASFNGSIVSWLGMDYYPPAGFMRQVCKQATCDVADSWIDVHIGFDVWSEVNEETEIEEFFVGLMTDVEATFYIYKYIPETNSMELQFQYSSTIRDDKFEESFNPLRHVRVLGYGHKGTGDVIYWGTPGYYEGYYEEDPSSGSVGYHSTSGTLVTAVWNPVSRTLHTVHEDDSEVGDPSSSVGSQLDLTAKYYQYGDLVSTGYYCYAYYTYHTAYSCTSFQYTPHGFIEPIEVFEGQCNSGMQGRDCWGGAITLAWSSIDIETNYGNFKIDGSSFSKGDITSETRTLRKITTQHYGGYCGTGVRYDRYAGGSSHCKPSSRKDYSFLGAVFSPSSGIAYSYNYATYEEVEINGLPIIDPNTVCSKGDYCSPIISGGNEKSAIDSAFPYDHNWRAILLEGTGRIDTLQDDLITTPRTGAVIYQKEDGTLFLMGGGFATTVLGDYERGFFKQIETSTEQEIEL